MCNRIIISPIVYIFVCSIIYLSSSIYNLKSKTMLYFTLFLISLFIFLVVALSRTQENKIKKDESYLRSIRSQIKR